MTRINRRSLIAAVGSTAATLSLSGCTDSTDNITDTESFMYTAEINNDIEFINYTVEMIQSEYSNPEEPMKLMIYLENASENPIEFGDKRDALFRNILADNHTTIPSNFSTQYNSENNYWYLEGAYFSTEDFQVGELLPNETINQEISVVASYDHSKVSTPPENITFESEIYAREDASLNEQPNISAPDKTVELILEMDSM